MKKRHLDRRRAALSRSAVERPLYFAFAFALPDLDDFRPGLAGRPGHGPSAEQMEVEVVDGLAALFAGVDDDTVAAIQLLAAGDLRLRWPTGGRAAGCVRRRPSPERRCAALGMMSR